MMRILSSSLVLALLSIMVMLELPLTVQPLLAAVIGTFRSGLVCAGPSWGHLWQMLMDEFHSGLDCSGPYWGHFGQHRWMDFTAMGYTCMLPATALAWSYAVMLSCRLSFWTCRVAFALHF